MGCSGSKADTTIETDEPVAVKTPKAISPKQSPREDPPVATEQVQLADKSEKDKVKHAKRKGVSAEATSNVSSSSYQKVVHEKSAEAREMIAKATAESTLFLGLSEEQREDVVSA